jgi:hypothetical protein
MVAPAVAGFLPAGLAITRFGRLFPSTREPLPLLNHQTPIPPPLRGLLSPEASFYKVSKTYALPLPPKSLQGPAKIWFCNAPARPVFLAYVRLKSNCTGLVARTNPPGSPLYSQGLKVAAGPSAFKHYVPPGVGSYINNGSCSYRLKPLSLSLPAA